MGIIGAQPGWAAFRDLFANYKRNAATRKHSFDLTEAEFRLLTQDRCFYCGGEPSNEISISKNGSYIYNGIDRSDNTQGYTVGNCVTCCFTCNFAKGDRSTLEFEEWALRIAGVVRSRRT